MIAKNTTKDKLEQALKIVNKKYANNIKWRRSPEEKGKIIRFTLRAINSRGKGGRIGHTGHRLGQSACWHTHGDFFDALFKLSPNAVIIAGKTKISIEGGNWQDRNIGSIMQPMMFSDVCDCEK